MKISLRPLVFNQSNVAQATSIRAAIVPIARNNPVFHFPLGVIKYFVMTKKKAIIKSIVPVLLPLKSDFVFKLVFGDQRRVDLLTRFLQAVLDIPAKEYENVTIIDPNVKKEYRNDKAGVLDVKITTKSGRVIDVEIQVVPGIPLIKRMVFYQSKMVTEQIGEGNDYDVIQQVITIVIADFIVIPNSFAYHHKFRYYDVEHGVELTDLKEIHTLELPKLPEESDMTELFDWLMLIKAQKREEYEMIAKKEPVFEKVVAVVKQLSADEQARMEYDKHEMWRMDYAATMRNVARIGREEGKAEGKIETARNLKRLGVAVDVIAESVGLSVEEIKQL
ncbi:MAG: Rpn family recombination-promoting nuclease/putative transposase [Planctomycetaceae bacterium]|nr:Rpn family recombination-promoting nuclease/putative transposase [Planctomycetaceae bacterium]